MNARQGLGLSRGVRERLFFDEEKLFCVFGETAAQLTRAAVLLAEGVDDPARLPTLTAAIRALSRKADEASHAVSLCVDQMFIPPVGRVDVHLVLSTRLRRVVETLGATARHALNLRAGERHEPTVQLARLLVCAAQEIEAAVLHLHDGHRVLAHCRAIKWAEKEGETIQVTAASTLFAGIPDSLEVPRWKLLFDQLGDVLNACGGVADELEALSAKHV